MNFGGNYRTKAAYYSGLGLTSSAESAKSFIESRVLLEPNLVVDDHFSVRSQWSLLQSPNFTPNSNLNASHGQGGYIFGDPNATFLQLSRAWLEWTSDYGVFRAGRMPVDWGYGLLWDSGRGVWDNFQTTLDRLEYRLHLGNIVGALAYSKGRKLSTLGNQNDQEFYTVYLNYQNPETEIEGGILYEKQVRARAQGGDYLSTTGTAPSPNPNKLPANHGNPYFLSNKMPYPQSNNILDVYLKQTFGYFSIGGEVGWLSGDAFDYNGDGKQDNLNAFGLMVNTAFDYHSFKAFLEFLYASGDNNLNGDHLNGFVLLHRNRSVGLILGQELLGPYYSSHVGFGNPTIYGNNDVFSGVYFFRPGVRFDWSPTWSSGLEVIIASKAAAAAGEEKSLGVEIDLGTEYGVYKNFDLGLNLGYLFSGKGLRVADPKGVFALRTTAALRF